MQLASGARVGQFEIVAELEFTGPTGVVYRAVDTEHGHPVALKVIPVDIAGDPDLRSKYLELTEKVSTLRHPNICAFRYMAASDVLVTEYPEGSTLAERLADGPLPLEEAVDVAVRVADALEGMHRVGVVHRALTPENVILTDSGVRLIDFGLEPVEIQLDTTARPDQSDVVDVPPTVFSASPERLMRQEEGVRSDIFRLGLLVHEMVWGAKVLKGQTSARRVAPESMDVPQDVLSSLNSVVASCFQEDVERRFEDVARVKKVLCSAIGLSSDELEHGQAPEDAITAGEGNIVKVCKLADEEGAYERLSSVLQERRWLLSRAVSRPFKVMAMLPGASLGMLLQRLESADVFFDIRPFIHAGKESDLDLDRLVLLAVYESGATRGLSVRFRRQRGRIIASLIDPSSLIDPGLPSTLIGVDQLVCKLLVVALVAPGNA